MFFGEVLHVCEEELDRTLSVYKSSPMKFICMRATIDRFLRSLPLNKPFPVIFEPAFTEANKA